MNSTWGGWERQLHREFQLKSGVPPESWTPGWLALSYLKESITGYTTIEAKDLDEATKIAQDNPYIASIRVYEVMGH